jgi:hypothetical protein
VGGYTPLCDESCAQAFDGKGIAAIPVCTGAHTGWRTTDRGDSVGPGEGGKRVAWLLRLA